MNKVKSTVGAVAALAVVGGGVALALPANATAPTGTSTAQPTAPAQGTTANHTKANHTKANHQARLTKVLARLVKGKKITADQAKAVAAQRKATPHATLKADLDKLVAAKTISAAQAKAILAAAHHRPAATATAGRPADMATNVVISTAVAKDLKMTPQALDQAIAKGTTIRQLAAQQHVSMQTLRHDVRAAVQAHRHR